ncbi:acetylornithine transaminase [Desulfotalea psychrophila]|uniref:Acetylornithine aminotransferase n=1 Tax=Desulfotalea psychrophila (strain LSv54 / DSM 12343) TaxID=177439 RepID=Q6AR57_DESPS|nr:acetylornithine transaminase [Desulfotalea psychrophila]CAG35167.1 probable acetylornithine aminotransferase [Desulfotalea psychrophila LSv54]
MTNESVKERADKVLVGNYGRYPVAFTEGTGCVLTDANGKKYVDFLAGIAVCSLGHCHPRIVNAIREQSERLIHVSNLYYTEAQTRLAELLVENSFGDKVFFCNSGAEANEAAIKLARIHAPAGKNKIISLTGAFHGRTMVTLAATGQARFCAGFEPIPTGFAAAPFADLDALEAMIDDTVCAVLCEPLQGEGGVRPLGREYLQGIRDICDRHGVLLIFDEVQTGVGRSGSLFAHQVFGVEPDIMTLAKGLASGMPIGAIITRDAVAASLVPGSHGSTFGGNPVVCAAASTNLEVILEDGFLAEVKSVAEHLAQSLGKLVKEFPAIFTEERGLGLLRGLVMTEEGKKSGSKIVMEMLEKGFLINFAGGVALRFAPPLVVSREQCDSLAAALREVLSVL